MLRQVVPLLVLGLGSSCSKGSPLEVQQVSQDAALEDVADARVDSLSTSEFPWDCPRVLAFGEWKAKSLRRRIFDDFGTIFQFELNVAARASVQGFNSFKLTVVLRTDLETPTSFHVTGARNDAAQVAAWVCASESQCHQYRVKGFSIQVTHLLDPPTPEAEFGIDFTLRNIELDDPPQSNLPECWVLQEVPYTVHIEPRDQ